MTPAPKAIRHWRRAAIVDLVPGRSPFRGHPIEERIGSVCPERMIWLMTQDNRSSPEQSALLEAALKSGHRSWFTIDADRRDPRGATDHPCRSGPEMTNLPDTDCQRFRQGVQWVHHITKVSR